MNAIATQTNRLVTSLGPPAAAIVLAGTNLLLPPSYGAVGREAEISSLGNTITYSAAVPTSVTIKSIRSGANEATRAFMPTGIRWNSYVARRLAVLRSGSGDFTGLKVPSSWVVDRAWAVANSYFRPNTPPPSVVPTEGGNVLFLWRKFGWELHVEIGSEETTVWAYHRKSRRSWSGSVEEQRPEFYSLLGMLGQS